MHGRSRNQPQNKSAEAHESMAPKEITMANAARHSRRNLKESTALTRLEASKMQTESSTFATSTKLDERPRKPEENTKSLDIVVSKEEYGSLHEKKIDRLEQAVIYLQTEVSRLGRQAQRQELIDENDAHPAGACDTKTVIDIERIKAKFKALEAAKLKAEKEKTEALSVATKLRQKLDEKQEALDKKETQSEGKDLEIELLRDLTLQQEQRLGKTEKAFQTSREYCKQLKAQVCAGQQQNPEGHFGSDSEISRYRDMGENTTVKETKVQAQEEWPNALQDGHDTPNKKRRRSSHQSDEEPNILAQHISKLASLADYFLVLDDGNFDLSMAASFISKIGQAGSYRQLQIFFEHAILNYWFCLQDILEKGLYAHGMSVNDCSQHERLPCLLVMVTVVDSMRHLTLSYTKSAMVEC
ncbi:hypothetical protein ACHAPU_008926 [Fusarium lateritium]